MKLLYKIIVFVVSTVTIMLVLPYLFTLLPADSGMAMSLILLFAIFPVYSGFVGFFSSTDIKRLFWMPIAEAASFPLLFSLAMGGWIPEMYIYSVLYLIAAYLVVGIVFGVRMIRKWEQRVLND